MTVFCLFYGLPTFYRMIYFYFLYALRPCRPILSGFVQKVCKDTPKRGEKRYPPSWNSSLLLLREHFITDFMLLPP